MTTTKILWGNVIRSYKSAPIYLIGKERKNVWEENW